MSNYKKAIPVEVSSSFNWGACLLTFFWALRYGVWKIIFISIAAFFVITFLGILISSWFLLLLLVMLVYFGFKGNSWAWERGNFSSIQDFLRAQRFWGRAGIVLYSSFFCFFIYMFNFSSAVTISLELANNNDKVAAYFGVPIKKDLFSFLGNVSYSANQSGEIIQTHIKVKGSKNTGYLIIDAKKIGGSWVPSKLAIEKLDHEILPIIGVINADI